MLLVLFYGIIFLYTASYSTALAQDTLANLLSNRTYSATLWYWLENEVVAHILEQDEL
jgi:hypothetical protein